MATPDKKAAGTRAAATQHHEFAMSRTTFVSFISHLVDGYPNPEEPMPPGPWDPVIRRALERAILRFGPLPDPWRPSMLDRVALNPQPLPPKVALAVTLAEEVVDRAVLIDQVAGGDNAPGPSAGTKYIADFIEDWCGTRPKRPPRPPKRSPFEAPYHWSLFRAHRGGHQQ